MVFLEGSDFIHSRKINVGCGLKKMDGWINVDINPDYLPDVIVDVASERLSDKFESADLVYSEHFIEHISKKDAEFHFKDVFDLLSPRGVIRVATVSLEDTLQKYLNGEWRKEEWTKRIGLKTGGEMLNSVFYGWGHQYIYDEKDLSNLMSECGFQVRRCDRSCSTISDFQNIETRFESTLILEGFKQPPTLGLL